MVLINIVAPFVWVGASSLSPVPVHLAVAIPVSGLDFDAELSPQFVDLIFLGLNLLVVLRLLRLVSLSLLFNFLIGLEDKDVVVEFQQ